MCIRDRGDGNDDDEGNDANVANGRAPIDDDDDKPEEGEVNGEVERSDGDEDMGDLEEGPDPEGLEDMLAGK